MRGFSLPFYQHQLEGLRRLRDNAHYALFWEQGTGKTAPMLQHICELMVAGGISDALIICPVSVIGSWERDIEHFQPIYRKLLRRNVTIVSYDTAWRRPELLRPWGCIVLDESHFIKNRGSKRSKFCRKLQQYANYRYILTGTPIGNGRLEEIWAQYYFLDPEIFGARFKQFEDRYCILDQYFKPRYYRYEDEVREKMFMCAQRIKKIDCLDLPEKLPVDTLKLELLEKTKYKEMLKNYITELDIEASNPLARMVKLRSLCSGFIKNEAGETIPVKCSKQGALEDLLDNWDKKLVIFAEFKESIRTIAETLKKLRIRHVILDGSQRDKNIWKSFQSDPKIQVIICQYRSASAGIDLYAADTMLFYEPTLSSQIFEQAKDRIHRSGQQHVCSYIAFMIRGTVEPKIYAALDKHADFSEQMLHEYVREEGAGG